MLWGQPNGRLTLDQIGNYLAGWSSPLAFFWLVLGFIQQGAELRQNSEALLLQAKELQLSVEQLTAQATTMAVSEKNQRLDVCIQLYKAALTRLSEVAAALLFRLESTSSDTLAQNELQSQFMQRWARYSSGNTDIFFGVLRATLRTGRFPTIEAMAATEGDRVLIRSIIDQYIETTRSAKLALKERDAPTFMIDHFERGSPGRLVPVFAQILEASPVVAERVQ
jgi:hypothetical protein